MQDLLLRYIIHVLKEEGVTFLEGDWRRPSKQFFTDEEWKYLRTLSDEAYKHEIL